MTKSFVPKLSPSKFGTKADQDHPDKPYPPKVYSGNLLTDCMHYCSTTQHGIIYKPVILTSSSTAEKFSEK